MKRRQRLIVLALTLLVSGGHAVAQAVYRCGPQANQYSQTPCADGRSVDASDVRDASQRQAAAQAAASDKRLAEALRSERLRAEQLAGGQSAGNLAIRTAPTAAQQAKAKPVKTGHGKQKKKSGKKRGENRLPEGVSPPLRGAGTAAPQR